VAIIFTQAAFATSGIISGIGFAIAKTIGSFLIVLTISEVKAHAAETQTKTSESLTASFSHHFIHLSSS
jgi:hypothetical protein